MPVITDRSTWLHITQEANMKKGPLVRVQKRPGQFVKMYEEDAIAAGLLPAKDQAKDAKAKAPAQNKMRQPVENKGVDPSPGPSSADSGASLKGEGEELLQAGDDFTVIPGIGPATARALKAHGIESFDALRQAGELDYVSPKAMAAIEEWRNG